VVVIDVANWAVAILVLVVLMFALNVDLRVASHMSFTINLVLASKPAPDPHVKESVMVEVSVLLVPIVTETL